MQLVMPGKYHFRQSGRQFGQKNSCYATHQLMAALLNNQKVGCKSCQPIKDFAIRDCNLAHNSEANCVMFEKQISLGLKE